MRCTCHRDPLHCIVPPYILDRLAASKDDGTRTLAIDAIEASADARATRRLLRGMPSIVGYAAPQGGKQRLVYDAQQRGVAQLPGRLVRREGEDATGDPAVDEAYDHSGITYDFYLKHYGRRSLDNRGMALVSSVHVGRRLTNAFWNGQQMAYGDGDGQAFVRFTKALDVVGHELTHGVISNECNLEYQGQSGALNEHFADVFGLLIRQSKKRQTADRADWLVGRDILGPGTRARGLRDFGPDKAFENDPLLGTDPQPKHLRDLYTGASDNGGVHINSGIPNHAFYRFARAVGGKAWEVPGTIWYETMRQLSPESQFVDMVRVTEMNTVARHGARSPIHKALMHAWKEVGL